MAVRVEDSGSDYGAAVVVIQGVSKSFGGEMVLDNVDMKCVVDLRRQ